MTTYIKITAIFFATVLFGAFSTISSAEITCPVGELVEKQVPDMQTRLGTVIQNGYKKVKRCRVNEVRNGETRIVFIEPRQREDNISQHVTETSPERAFNAREDARDRDARRRNEQRLEAGKIKGQIRLHDARIDQEIADLRNDGIDRCAQRAKVTQEVDGFSVADAAGEAFETGGNPHEWGRALGLGLLREAVNTQTAPNGTVTTECEKNYVAGKDRFHNTYVSDGGRDWVSNTLGNLIPKAPKRRR